MQVVWWLELFWIQKLVKWRTKYKILTTAVLITKISEVENKIPGHAKYIFTPEFNKLTAEYFTAKLREAYLVNKTDFDNKLTSYNKKYYLV